MTKNFVIFYLATSLLIVAMAGAGYQIGYQRAYQQQEARVLACATEWWNTMESLNYALSTQASP